MELNRSPFVCEFDEQKKKNERQNKNKYVGANTERPKKHISRF